MSNICCSCMYHEICIMYRYSNTRTKFMVKINTSTNKDGDTIIFVDKCSKYAKRRFKYFRKKSEKVLDK